MSNSIEKIRKKQSDVTRNIDTKKNELNQLEQRKQELIDSGIDIQNSDMDNETIIQVMELINRELEENSEKGKELSNEMQEDLISLNEMKSNVSEMIESTEKNRSSLEQKKSILDKFGLGRNVDNAISELEDSKTQLNELNSSLIDTEKNLSDTSQRLNML